MSAFGGGTSFQIFNDDSENQTAVMRKAKREDASGKPPATKRAALGVLSNNTRVQPLRAVKQVNEEAGPRLILNVATILSVSGIGVLKNIHNDFI